jgi:pimeloyl-ACP methyl ester carboxylesterase
MFLVAGGPGQGSAGSFDLAPGFTRDLMRFMFPNYTLVAFDNRGTGQSALINCPGLQNTLRGTVEQFAALAGACATVIGPQRVFYSTREHADDIDSVREALGIDKIGLYGVSYGTKLLQAYASRHPTHVDRLILDSVVGPGFPDPFDRNVLHEMPGALAGFCSGGTCRAATPNFPADVVALANRLEAKPARGRIIGGNGRAKTVTMNGEEFLQTVIDADLSPGLAGELPAAVRAARGGNMRPVLRLYDLDLEANKLTAEELSFGLNAATNCADGRFPWSPSTAPSARRAVIDSTLAAQPAGTFAPFGDWAARLGIAFFCEQWPSPAGNTPIATGPLPNVPALVLNGGFDLRTPVASAVTVVNLFPQGQLIVVPGVGHSVTTADFSGCAWNSVRRWILGTLNAPSRAQCPPVPPLIKVLGAFPSRPKRPTASTTFTIVGKTLREAQATWFQLSSEGYVPRGLYGGKLVSLRNVNGFTLTRYSLAPGIVVSGRITLADIGPPTTYAGTVRVAGSAAVAGHLTINKNGRISGTLGERRVSGRY